MAAALGWLALALGWLALALGWLALASGCASRGEDSAPAKQPATPAPEEPAMDPGYAQPPADMNRDGADSEVSVDDEKNGRFDSADDASAAFERSKLALDDACHNACSALGSMRRSVDALCDLAGDDDSRCRDARGVLETSSRRVDQAGCRC
jgi:hypothetical protein